MSTKNTALSLAVAVAGAVSVAALTTTPAQAAVKCYGISKAGQNDCANAAGTHSCKGGAKIDYDGGEWKVMPSKDACEKAKGQIKPFNGVNPNLKS